MSYLSRSDIARQANPSSMRGRNISETLSCRDLGAHAADIGDSLVIFGQHMKTRCVMSVLEYDWDYVWLQGIQLEGDFLEFLLRYLILRCPAAVSCMYHVVGFITQYAIQAHIRECSDVRLGVGWGVRPLMVHRHGRGREHGGRALHGRCALDPICGGGESNLPLRVYAQNPQLCCCVQFLYSNTLHNQKTHELKVTILWIYPKSIHKGFVPMYVCMYVCMY
jgi:hypothetical protein